MTKHYKYEVEINGEIFKFKTIKEICEFLQLSYTALYNLRSGRTQFKHCDKKHLKDVVVRKVDYERVHKKNQPILDKNDYLQSCKKKYEDGVY